MCRYQTVTLFFRTYIEPTYELRQPIPNTGLCFHHQPHSSIFKRNLIGQIDCRRRGHIENLKWRTNAMIWYWKNVVNVRDYSHVHWWWDTKQCGTIIKKKKKKKKKTAGIGNEILKQYDVRSPWKGPGISSFILYKKAVHVLDTREHKNYNIGETSTYVILTFSNKSFQVNFNWSSYSISWQTRRDPGNRPPFLSAFFTRNSRIRITMEDGIWTQWTH